LLFFRLAEKDNMSRVFIGAAIGAAAGSPLWLLLIYQITPGPQDGSILFGWILAAIFVLFPPATLGAIAGGVSAILAELRRHRRELELRDLPLVGQSSTAIKEL
jgi:hypothetical protein